jgi:hypothetical protein
VTVALTVTTKVYGSCKANSCDLRREITVIFIDPLCDRKTPICHINSRGILTEFLANLSAGYVPRSEIDNSTLLWRHLILLELNHSTIIPLRGYVHGSDRLRIPSIRELFEQNLKISREYVVDYPEGNRFKDVQTHRCFLISLLLFHFSCDFRCSIKRLLLLYDKKKKRGNIRSAENYILQKICVERISTVFQS